MTRIDLDGPIVILQGQGELFEMPVGISPFVVGFRMLGVDLERLAVVLDRPPIFALGAISCPPVQQGFQIPLLNRQNAIERRIVEEAELDEYGDQGSRTVRPPGAPDGRSAPGTMPSTRVRLPRCGTTAAPTRRTT